VADIALSIGATLWILSMLLAHLAKRRAA